MKKIKLLTYVKVLLEFSTNDTIGTVGSGDLTPDITELVTLDGSWSLVDEGNTLTVVELRSISVINTVNLEKSSVVVGVTTSSLETKEGTLDVNTGFL